MDVLGGFSGFQSRFSVFSDLVLIRGMGTEEYTYTCTNAITDYTEHTISTAHILSKMA